MIRIGPSAGLGKQRDRIEVIQIRRVDGKVELAKTRTYRRLSLAEYVVCEPDTRGPRFPTTHARDRLAIHILYEARGREPSCGHLGWLDRRLLILPAETGGNRE